MSLGLGTLNIASTTGAYIFPHALRSIDVLQFPAMYSTQSLNSKLCVYLTPNADIAEVFLPWQALTVASSDVTRYPTERLVRKTLGSNFLLYNSNVCANPPNHDRR